MHLLRLDYAMIVIIAGVVLAGGYLIRKEIIDDAKK